MKKLKLLVVEDDPNYRMEIQEELEAGFSELEFFYADNLAEACLKARKIRPDLVLMDIIFPTSAHEDLDYRAGVRLVEYLLESGFEGSLLILSSQDKTFAVELLTRYRAVADYFFKDTSFKEIRSRLKRHVQNELDRQELFRHRLKEVNLIGKSPSIQRIRELSVKLGSSDSSILITGESGVGKEVAARYFHAVSDASSRPFIAINCAAIPENLFESHFFGHVKGAFTGAHTDQDGYLKALDGGVLFLDEVGELPLAMQAKLLRVLQEKCFSPVGSNDVIKVQFRLICATNRDLSAQVKNKEFREDLYYRIHVIPVFIPPLKERPEDLGLLVQDFLKKWRIRHGVERHFTEEAHHLLSQYPWPGNIRELNNSLERILVLCDSMRIEKSDVELILFGGAEREIHLEFPLAGTDYKELKQKILDEFHRRYFRFQLDSHGGSIRQTAEAVGYNRTDLAQLVKRLRLKEDDSKD